MIVLARDQKFSQGSGSIRPATNRPQSLSDSLRQSTSETMPNRLRQTPSKTSDRALLFILSGSLRKDVAGVWHTTMWGDQSEFLVLGDRLRIEAGALLYKHNPETQIVVLGGCGTLCVAGAPVMSSVMKRELVELGVPADTITEESITRNTMEQVRYIQSLVTSHLPSGELVILSNQYHLPRIQAMLGASSAKLLGAEDVLLQYDPEKWRGVIETAEQSSRMKEIIAAERQGVEAWRKGEYRVA